MSEFQTNSLSDLMKHLSLKYSVATLDSWRSQNAQTEAKKSAKKQQKVRKTFLKSIHNFDSQIFLEEVNTQQKITIKNEYQKNDEFQESKLTWNQNIEQYVSQLLTQNETLKNELIQMRQLVREQENVIDILASKLK